MSQPRDYTIVFAGAGTQDVSMRGQYVRILDASGDVFISVDNSSELKRRKGQAVNVFGFFNSITVRSAIAQTVQVCISETPQDDSSQAVSVSATATVTPSAVLGADSQVSVAAMATALIAAGSATRLSLLISNPITNTAAIRIGGVGVGATKGISLEPDDSMTIDTTAAVYAYNTHATLAQNVEVLSAGS